MHSTQDAAPAATVQCGRPAAHVAGVSYCPLGLHVSTASPLHVDDPGVHAWHVPSGLHVPPLHAVPDVFGAYAHALFTHATVRQSFTAAGHWLAVVHATHAPVLGSHVGVVPLHAGFCAYCPLLPHTSGTLPLQIAVPGVHRLHWPAPSHLPRPDPHTVPDAFGA